MIRDMNVWFVPLGSTRLYYQNKSFILEKTNSILCDISYQETAEFKEFRLKFIEITHLCKEFSELEANMSHAQES